MKKDLKVSLLLAAICFVGGLFLVPYQFKSLQSMLPEEFQAAIDSLTMPFPIIMIISAIQLAVVSFIISYIGIKLARKVGFTLPVLDSLMKKEKVQFNNSGVILAIVFGVITGFAIIGADRFYYQHKIEAIAQANPEFSWLGLVAGVLYGGVFEELLMRLLFMSLVVWIFMKITRKNYETLNSIFFWLAIILAAALFAIGHFPATEAVFGELNTTLIIRSFLLNGLGGIFFGYLYWKKGLEYAILAHMFTHISMQLIWIPILY
ncbi:MAG TPA: CPBP family glutamic-type intramembrane protease [Ureibacillus sp.]|nr:CPBP family glutamic-type intramembrane protease [Ureibacillus sp.]